MARPILTREEFIHETLIRSRRAISQQVQATYWNLLGKALGYVEADNQTNIAIFKDVTIEAMDFLKQKGRIPLSSTLETIAPLDEKKR